MSTVLIEPAELQATTGRMIRTAAGLAEVGALVLATTASLPPGSALELAPGVVAAAGRLERLASELAAEAGRQELVVAATLGADATAAVRSWIDTRPSDYWMRLITACRFWMQEAWSLGGRTLPFYVNVLGFGYRLERRGDIVVAEGRRVYAPRLLAAWLAMGRLPGRDYAATNALVREELLNFEGGGGLARVGAAAWRAVSHDAWALRDDHGALLVGRGAGRVSLVLSLAPDGFDYSAWGPHRSEGWLSSGFASSVMTDVGISLGQMAVSAGAGAAVGTFCCPLAGTAVGFATGLVVGAAVEFTPGGRAVRDTVQQAVKREIDDSVEGGRELLSVAARRATPGPWVGPQPYAGQLVGGPYPG